jgi:5-methylcytosine-specific restriction endonuclease McrA
MILSYEYIKNRRAKKAARGECRDCSNKNLSPSIFCFSCNEKEKRYRFIRRNKLKRLGICPVCGVNKPPMGAITCLECVHRAVNHKKKRFFHSRSVHFNNAFNTSHTACDLASIWRKQKGLCVLSGRLLTPENAELDHVLPKSRGGSHDTSNLQWVVKEVNRCKRDLLESEFIVLCFDVVKNNELS